MLKNTTKVICVMVTMALLASGLLMAVPSLTATSSGNDVAAQKAPAYDMMDIDQLKAKQTGDIGNTFYADSAPGLNAYAPGDFYNVSDQARFYVGENGKWYYNGSVFSPSTSAPSSYMTFTKRAEGSMVEVWVANDLEYFPGDPRNAVPENLLITDELVAYIVDQFDKYLGLPSVLMGFGLPDDNLHAPNEKFHLPNFYRGIDAVAHYLERLGR